MYTRIAKRLHFASLTTSGDVDGCSPSTAGQPEQVVGLAEPCRGAKDYLHSAGAIQIMGGHTEGNYALALLPDCPFTHRGDLQEGGGGGGIK